MRAKVPTSKKCKTRGLSIKPELKQWAERRAGGAMLGFSGYVSLLLDYDRENDLLTQILQKRMKEAAK